MEPSTLFDACNNSELYQLARAAGIPAQPNTPRQRLIARLLGEEEVEQTEVPEIDEWRLAIMRFVIEHRRVLHTQLSCPAKSLDPRACFGCIDTQVVVCLANDDKNMQLIALHKKPNLERP